MLVDIVATTDNNPGEITEYCDGCELRRLHDVTIQIERKVANRRKPPSPESLTASVNASDVGPESHNG